MTLPLLAGPIAGALLRTSGGDGAEAIALIANNDPLRRFVWLTTAMAGRWPAWDAATAGIIVLVIYIGLKARSLTVHPGLLLAMFALICPCPRRSWARALPKCGLAL